MTTRNVAVFIDAENLFKGYGKLEIPEMPMAELLKQLEDAVSREAGAGSIAVSRAFADWNALGLEDYRRDVERAGVKTVQVFSAGKASKNAADIELVVDCLRVAAELEQLEVFIIVSADGDFVPLVRRLHEIDKYVVGATLADHPVNSLLENEVDQYVALRLVPAPPAAALEPVFSADGGTDRADVTPVAKKAGTTARRATKKETPKGAKPSAKPAAKKPPDKVNWHALARQIPVVHADAAESPDDYKAIIKEILSEPKVRSFCDRLANQGGTLPLLAMAIKAAAPRLSPSDARVSSLSRALRFGLADTPYALARESDDGQPVLVRRSKKAAGVLPDLSLDDIERGVQ